MRHIIDRRSRVIEEKKEVKPIRHLILQSVAKPFQLGDRILIENFDGVVEDVGFRSTRIRTLTGHLVTIPNEKIVSSGVENIAKRPHTRWLTNIAITYDTPPDKVEKAVSIIKKILDNHQGMHPDFPPRVYFNGFNGWSLNIMVIAWYHPANYWDMQEWLQRTCLEILRRFNDEVGASSGWRFEVGGQNILIFSLKPPTSNIEPAPCTPQPAPRNAQPVLLTPKILQIFSKLRQAPYFSGFPFCGQE